MAEQLKDNPKVQALVEKEVSKAVKAETKRILDLIKASADTNKELEDKAQRAAVAASLKGLVASVKSPISA